MKKILILLAFFYCKLHAQQYCCLIFDKQNNRVVPFASIYYKTARLGVYSDEYGKFCYQIVNDTISVSALGFESSKVSVVELSKNDTLFLNNSPIKLQEVTIRTKKSKQITKKLGFSNNKVMGSDSYNPNSGFKIATFIDTKNFEEYLIKSVSCELSPFRKKIINKYRIRLRLYTNDTYKHLPKDDILSTNVVIDVPNYANKIEFDIENYNIRVPEGGFWVCTESLGYFVDDDKYFPIDDRKFGKNNVKSSKKTTGTLSPSYIYIQAGEKNSAFSYLNNVWRHENYKPNLTFCFSVLIKNF